jgi:hypothetical protein
MPRFQCLLCDTPFEKPANHFCARECMPAAGQHVDFCRQCKSTCLNGFEFQVSSSADEGQNVVPSPESRRTD